MDAKSRTGECFRQEVCVLLLRLYGDHIKLHPEYKLPQKMISNIDVFRARRAHTLDFMAGSCPLGILENRDTTRTNIMQELCLLYGVCQCYALSLVGRKRLGDLVTV